MSEEVPSLSRFDVAASVLGVWPRFMLKNQPAATAMMALTAALSHPEVIALAAKRPGSGLVISALPVQKPANGMMTGKAAEGQESEGQGAKAADLELEPLEPEPEPEELKEAA